MYLINVIIPVDSNTRPRLLLLLLRNFLKSYYKAKASIFMSEATLGWMFVMDVRSYIAIQYVIDQYMLSLYFQYYYLYLFKSEAFL